MILQGLLFAKTEVKYTPLIKNISHARFKKLCMHEVTPLFT